MKVTEMKSDWPAMFMGLGNKFDHEEELIELECFAIFVANP